MQKRDNPWNLTPAEARAMDAMCEHGSQKAAAFALGLSIKTVERQCTMAGQRMQIRTMLGRYIAWDRWRRGG